jgi:hypothetical protein
VVLPFTAAAGSLIITNLTVAGGDARIDWNSSSNLYIPARTPSLVTGVFEYVGAVVATNSAIISNLAEVAFYRIRQVEPVTFPDPHMESAVRAAIPHKYSPTNLIYDIDLEPITSFDASFSSISNATGIAWMVTLTNLNLSWSQLSHLDISGNTNLTTLDCTGNLIADLNVLANTRLRALWCSDTLLTHLDTSSNRQLTVINCARSSLTNLIAPQDGDLVYLYCMENQLTVLDISGNTNLLEVYALENPLAEIVVWDTNNLPSVFEYSTNPAPWIHEP